MADFCVLLNGLGRFQNVLGTFQEAQFFWGAHARANPTKTNQTPLDLGKGMGRGKHKGKYRGYGLGVW